MQSDDSVDDNGAAALDSAKAARLHNFCVMERKLSVLENDDVTPVGGVTGGSSGVTGE